MAENEVAQVDPMPPEKAKRSRRNNIRPFHQRKRTEENHSRLDDFHSWLSNLGKRLKAVYGLILLVPGSAAALGFSVKELGLRSIGIGLNTALVSMLFFQSLVIVVLYWLIPDPPPDEPVREVEAARHFMADGRAISSSRRFTQSWRRAWLWWSILYFAMGSIVLWAIFKGTDLRAMLKAWSPLLAFIDNVETIFIFMCFRELSPSVREDKVSDIVVGLAVILLFISAAQYGATQFLAIAWLGKLLGLLGGFAAGLALALLVGRLESKLVGAPLYVTILLYLYAAIQGSFVFLPDDLAVMLLLTSIAFIFKVFLFLFMA
jgi:hypothetical protein